MNYIKIEEEMHVQVLQIKIMCGILLLLAWLYGCQQNDNVITITIYNDDYDDDDDGYYYYDDLRRY